MQSIAWFSCLHRIRLHPSFLLQRKNESFEDIGETNEHLLGSNETVSTEVVSDTFVCEMYGNKRVLSVNEFRYLGFMKFYKNPKKEKTHGKYKIN